LPVGPEVSATTIVPRLQQADGDDAIEDDLSIVEQGQLVQRRGDLWRLEMVHEILLRAPATIARRVLSR